MTESMPEVRRLIDAAQAVVDLFGQHWPRIEVIASVDTHDRPTLPLSDDDADKVRALRKALRGVS